MQELEFLITKFDSQLATWRGGLAETFTLENGSAQLSPWFAEVRLHHYEDSLLVTEDTPIVNYILSGRVKLAEDRQRALAQFVKQELQLLGGEFYITKDVGTFEASGSVAK